MHKDTALIFDIQRFCVYDGPGIRSTVFFKGCNMRCAWCHNPESFSQKPELLFHPEKCTACGACTVCPQHAHQIEGGEHRFDREACLAQSGQGACGQCVLRCPNGALELSGREMTVEQVMAELKKDGKYYASSGGGVTLSGGEASLWLDFVCQLLEACRAQGFHTALETNGLISPERLQRLIPLVDLFLFDCKHTDPEEHRRWTGAPLEPVLASLEALDRAGAAVILRCPIIPGVNDTQEHFKALRTLRASHACIQQAEVMAYHDIGKGKWQALGKPYELESLKTVSARQKQEWQAMLDGK